MQSTLGLTWLVPATALVLAGAMSMAAGAAEPLFETDIQPLLAAKCGKCHSAKTRKGGLDLSQYATIRRGGESGEPGIGESLDESLLWSYVEANEMPPEGEPDLTDEERGLLREWIAGGAKARNASGHVTQHDVLPYLYARCVVCHGRRKQSGGLDLRSVASILEGGDSGPAVVPGKPEQSLLIRRVHAKDMPPPKELIRAGVRPLESPEIERITQWIAQGARHYDVPANVQTTTPDSLVTDEDRQFWSFQPPCKPKVPTDAGQPTAWHGLKVI